MTPVLTKSNIVTGKERDVLMSRSILHRLAANSESFWAYKAGLVYNAAKMSLGLGKGIGTLIDPSVGREELYKGKIISLSEARNKREMRTIKDGRLERVVWFEDVMDGFFQKLSTDSLKEWLGGKAWSLVFMKALGLKVPEFFVLPTYQCGKCELIKDDDGNVIARKLIEKQKRDIKDGLEKLERATGLKFGLHESRKSPSFFQEEFFTIRQIKKLCKVLKKNIDFSSVEFENSGNTIEWLNEALTKDLYGLCGSQNRVAHIIKELREGGGLGTLVSATAGYRDKELSTLDVAQQRKRLWLSRIIIEEIAEEFSPKICPKKNEPLTTSGRSGAKISLPGMLRTILNMGLYKELVDVLVANALEIGDEALAYSHFDSYATLLEQMGDDVFGCSRKVAEARQEAFDEKKSIFHLERAKIAGREAVTTLKNQFKIVAAYEALYSNAKVELPKDHNEQAYLVAESVLSSWNSPRAEVLKKAKRIPERLGTAVIFVKIAPGNSGGGTGVIYSRHSNTGKGITGDMLFNAQGEAVVSGKSNTTSLNRLKKSEDPKLRALHDEIVSGVKLLEREGKAPQDVEITVVRDRRGRMKLYYLQTRKAQMSAKGFVESALSMVEEGIITEEEAIMMIEEPEKMKEFVLPIFDEADLAKARKGDGGRRLLAKGVPAAFGAGCGAVYLDSDELAAKKAENKKIKGVLVAEETSQDNVAGMLASEAIVTSTGSRLCHASVIANMYGIPCVVAVLDLEFAVKDGKKGFVFNGEFFEEGTVISVNAKEGEVFLGEIKTVIPDKLDERTIAFRDMAARHKRLKIYANTEMATAQFASDLGAEGVGLQRTEHQFLGPDRLVVAQQAIIKCWQYYFDSNDSSEKKEIFQSLSMLMDTLGQQQEEDNGIMYGPYNGRWVTTRLFDAPLEEFFVKISEKQRASLATTLNMSREKLDFLLKKIMGAKEGERGFRGARMGVLFPIIYETQVRASFNKIASLIKDGKDPKVKIEIPVVTVPQEVRIIKDMILKIRDEVAIKEDVDFSGHYKIGIMVETPSSMDGEVAREIVEILGEDGFGGVGSNDGIGGFYYVSRNEAPKTFLGKYVELLMYPHGTGDPFRSVMPAVVNGIRRFADIAKSISRSFEMLLCGEHGADPYSIGVLDGIESVDAVSVSPFNILTAILAAAQAAIRREKTAKMPLSQALMMGSVLEKKKREVKKT